MLIHITPRIYLPYGMEANILDVTIDEIGLTLKGGTDIKVCRPYPNKNYWIARAKTGRKAVAGILVDTPSHIDRFTVVSRWAVGTENIAVHRVDYEVLDADYQAVTDNIMLWYGCSGSLGDWASRWPEGEQYQAPVYEQPTMELFTGAHAGPPRTNRVHDRLDAAGRITERVETFRIPTVEPDRIVKTRLTDIPIPTMESVIRLG